MKDTASVSPLSTGILCIMVCIGVSCFDPPNGISTVPAPIVESNLSESPLLEQILRSPAIMAIASSNLPLTSLLSPCPEGTSTSMCFSAPFEFRNSLEISTIAFPFHSITSLGSSVTTATFVASRFSEKASSLNLISSSGATTTAILSWDSLMASSVPSSPSYFFGTALRSI